MLLWSKYLWNFASCEYALSQGSDQVILFIKGLIQKKVNLKQKSYSRKGSYFYENTITKG